MAEEDVAALCEEPQEWKALAGYIRGRRVTRGGIRDLVKPLYDRHRAWLALAESRMETHGRYVTEEEEEDEEEFIDDPTTTATTYEGSTEGGDTTTGSELLREIGSDDE
ncbi:uncharacterized protein EV422DRAFT_572604 [Fimicolochytrium jonesii]|uniref:uncharacterized protein n=1 Tax=Fimicolochytrium jonesii TaxID=1396493 RepID=UPI0022FE89BB|nr:uncharacterized protein EV422DRAFT_572604 [Fimicolochytrium jonesii]KAI8815615.1 hypothetical protein EV422DRAFT_572604 [Fimicolochytrium jonesii]